MAEGDDKITGFLTKKAGPLPIGVWIIAVGGGIAIAVYMRRNAAAAGDELPTEVDDSSWNQGGNTFTPGGVGGSAGSGSNVNPLPTAPADNDEWLRRATNLLEGRGLSGSQVLHSLGQFLSGQSLTAQDRAIVDMAIAAVGAPPTAPPPAPNAPPPPPTVPPRTNPPMPGTPGPAPRPTLPGPPVTPRLVSSSAGRATVQVTTVRGATSYRWFIGGRLVNSTPGAMVTLTNLPRRTRIQVSVQPQNAAGNGPMSRGLTFTTK